MKKLFLSFLSLLIMASSSYAAIDPSWLRSAPEPTLFEDAEIMHTMVTEENTSFSDLQEDSENFEAIQYLKENNIVQGYADGSFKEDQTINRAEFLKIVLESKEDFNLETAKQCSMLSSVQPFTDVKVDDWFFPYTCYARLKGIISGYADGSFQAAQEINVPEMAKIVAKTQGLTVEALQDNEEWYTPFIKALEVKNALPTSFINFEYKIQRGEMAEVLFRLKTNNTSKSSLNFSDLQAGINNTDKLISGNIGRIKSAEELREIMKIASVNNSTVYRGAGIMEEAVMNDAAVPTAEKTLSSTSSDEGSTDFSETNIQVIGVDEADTMKNDGEFIYTFKDRSVRIIKAYPSEKMAEVSVIKFDDDGFNPNQMFLNGDQLVVIGNTWKNEIQECPADAICAQPLVRKMSIMPGEYYPWYRGSNETKVYLIDITNREKPEITREISYEGNYSSARRIDDIMYLIVNKTPNYYFLEREERAIDDIIPFFSDTAFKEENSASKITDIKYFPGYETPNYIIVSAIPLDSNKTKVKRQVFLGASDNVYMSKDALFVATGVRGKEDKYWNYDNTQVYKFNLEALNINYKATQVVPGRILNQFSMDQFGDQFRIATTKGQVWGTEEKSTNRLYVLDNEMEITGKLENIAPGERIYSARFMGNRAFVVTFKTVDPLFVIDLQDATKPTILGELKIPGYSDYLHPFDENHLLGFGKEVDESIDADKVHSADAVYYTAVQGMKVSLFDISDLANPKEKFKTVIGDRGTYSELLNNHKALLFDKEKELLAFPINIQEQVNYEEEKCSTFLYSSCPNTCQQRCIPSQCTKNLDGSVTCTDDCEGLGSCMDPNYERFETTFNGALILNINANTGFSERGRIISSETMDDYGYTKWEEEINRILYIGENLYTVSPSTIKAADLETVKVKKVLELK